MEIALQLLITYSKKIKPVITGKVHEINHRFV